MNDSFYGKTILVTGGTGSIGSEIVRQLLPYNPQKIRVFSRGEYGQHRLRQEIGSDEKRVRFIVGDIRDRKRLAMAMENIDIVFHAAALKHVDICEDNPFETVQTNILGTQNMIELARENNIEKVVAVSTDKAVNPEGILGVSKLAAEKLILNAYYYKGDKQTKFACVRFGNVLGSQGSFLPTIKRLVEEKKQVSITNPNMTRFFMTVPQSVELVLKAAHMMQSHEIFVLKMPAITIGDFVEEAVAYYEKKFGRKTGSIKKKMVGHRLGEKIHEQLLAEHEVPLALETDDMYILTPSEGAWGQKYHQVYSSAVPIQNQNFSSEHAPKLKPAEIRKLIRLADSHITIY